MIAITKIMLLQVYRIEVSVVVLFRTTTPSHAAYVHLDSTGGSMFVGPDIIIQLMSLLK